MSCKLSKDLKVKYDCRSVPVRKGDTVKIYRGCKNYGGKGVDGKVISVYRRRWCIHVEKIVRDKRSGNTVPVPIDPSNCEITQLKLDKSRKTLLARKNRANQGGIQGADKMDWVQRKKNPSLSSKYLWKLSLSHFDLEAYRVIPANRPNISSKSAK